ncbi:phosphopantetheine-binding protein [Motiliproteus sediminis]|uniref:phosphopantetheine-binding protein n=1 Tax=Motiliproteus sediminis TaxID=1468178 RepID=UPI001AEF7DE6|nr:phosphopantetheine-binding protein [Motiliproteus sediminis]
MDIRSSLRQFIEQRLLEYGDTPDFDGDESLILSARLDSLAVLFIVMHIEQEFGVYFDELSFELEDFDTLDQMVVLVENGLNDGR